MDLLEGLNKAQIEAVTTTEGPVMVMAGAGSGKTKVLTTRIAYIIDKLGVLPNQILAVTFTNKAAREMKERIEKMIEVDTKYMWISTFHAFCAKLLRFEMNNMPPYSKNFTILDEEDSLKIVKEIVKKESINEFKPKELKNAISKAKNFPNFSIKDPAFSNAYDIVSRMYETYLKENDLLDFDDLIIKAIELFRKNPDILEKYQRKFAYILVDEFQDTNTLQYNLMFMLAVRHHNIFVVGDDFQSIYSFRGAKIENINRFRKDFLENKLFLLEENYRSTTQILDLANCVITKNPNQIKKKMFSTRCEGQKPFYYQADSSYDEVMFVVNKIKELVVAGDQYKDCAIIYRANYVSRSFEDMLIRYQIPYKIYGGLSFFSRKEIKDIIAYLRVIVNKFDDFSFRRIINEPKRKIGPMLIEKLSIEAATNNTSLFNAIESYKGNGLGVNALKEFKKVIDSIAAQIESTPLKSLVDIILKETGYEDMLRSDESSYDDRIANIKELKTVLKEAEEFYEGDNVTKLELLLADLSLRTDADDDDMEKDNYIRLTTYHQAKGLEFNNVFLVAMEEEIFPSINVISDSDIEEERRICYVGITRAKKKLYITNAYSRYLFGSLRYLKPSRFIQEMNEELFKNITKGFKKFDDDASSKKASMIILDKPTETPVKNTFVAGDKINHKAFGDGIVVAVAGDVITVAFSVNNGIKKLIASHPAIRKL